MAVDLNGLTNQLLQKGNVAYTDTIHYAGWAVDEARNIFTQSWAPPIVNTVFKDPSGVALKDPTNVDLREDFSTNYENYVNELKNKFPIQVKNFLDEYFPKAPCESEVMSFLCQIIKDGGKALPKNIQDQIWNQARDKENIELARLEAEVYNETSSRGFGIPPGSISARVLAATNISSMNTSRTIADLGIKEMEMRLDFIKFAIDAIIKTRIQAIDAALRYIASFNDLDRIALGKTTGFIESYKIFYQSINAYVNSINELNRLNLEKDKINAMNGMENIKLFLSNNDSIRKWRTSTMVQAANSISGLAQAAISATQIVGSVSQNLANATA